MNERDIDERDEQRAFDSRRPDLNERGGVEEPTSQVVHDPVCHKDFPANESSSSVEYEGFTYYFCSETCRQAFDNSPDEVIEAENAYTHLPPASPAKEVPRPFV
jgi:YHS domain-containing protein